MTVSKRIDSKDLCLSTGYPGAQQTTCETHMSKFSFQYGLSVFLMTLVVCVCSPSTVMTANGSGRRKTSRFASESAATTGGCFKTWQERHPVVLVEVLGH